MNATENSIETRDLTKVYQRWVSEAEKVYTASRTRKGEDDA